MFHDLAGRRLLPRIPKPVLRRLLGLGGPARSRAQRLAMFPRDHLPLEQPATIRWNAQMVPFIEAGSDCDLAFCLGMVHAHLREAQLEFLKMLAFGRLAEFLGPLAIKADHAIRIADFAHWRTAGYAIFHREAPLYRAERPGEGEGHFNYVIARRGVVTGATEVAADGDVVLSRLTTPCTPDPAYDWHLE